MKTPHLVPENCGEWEIAILYFALGILSSDVAFLLLILWSY